ncbi:MAG: hypothetical protein HYS33_08015 [Acidobacteria bacterium]|nr:hypothetical protein [Acidobacteriota bacterium]
MIVKKATLIVTCLLLLGIQSFQNAAAQSATPPGVAILEFKTLVGVSGPFVGASNPIRGVPGAGLPWVISDGRGSLKAGGKLEIHVKGLVLADDPAVPEALRLTNPISMFRGLVSCMIIDGSGNPSFVNVSTDGFPADSAGNSKIDATVELPGACFAPLIFVTSPGGAWFAITGK